MSRASGRSRAGFAAGLVSLVLMLAPPAVPPALAANGGEVVGRLLGPDGTPLRGYVIRLVGRGDRAAESRPTKSDGSFSLAALPAGAYSVVVLAEDRSACDTSVAPAVVPDSGSLEIDLKLESLPVCEGPVPPEPAPMKRPPRPRAGGNKALYGSIAAGAGLLLLSGGGGSERVVSEASP